MAGIRGAGRSKACDLLSWANQGWAKSSPKIRSGSFKAHLYPRIDVGDKRFSENRYSRNSNTRISETFHGCFSLTKASHFLQHDSYWRSVEGRTELVRREASTSGTSA